MGDRLVRLIWESVLNDAPIRQKQLVPWSPMAALVRLYGSVGPALAVGMHDTEEPRRFVSETKSFRPPESAETIGWLETSHGRELRFVFEWRLDSGRLLSIGPWDLGLVGPFLLAGYGEVARGLATRIYWWHHRSRWRRSSRLLVCCSGNRANGSVWVSRRGA